MLLDPLIRKGLKAAQEHAPPIWPPLEFDGDVLIIRSCFPMFNYCFLIADDIDDVSLLKFVKPIDRLSLPPPPPPTLAPNKYLFERRSVSQGKLLPRHDQMAKVYLLCSITQIWRLTGLLLPIKMLAALY